MTDVSVPLESTRWATDDDKTEWTTVIVADSSALDLHLIELLRYRDLVKLLVRRDFVAQYKQTVLGPLWHIISPLCTTLMMSVVFGRIARISTDGLPPFLFYMAGTTVWNYFSRVLNATASSFVSNAGVFGKVYFPRLAIPVAQTLSSLVGFGIQLGLLLACLGVFALRGFAFHPTPWLFALPVVILLASGLGLGLGLIASALTVRYRDLMQVIGFAVQLLMYATPVIYPVSAVPPALRRYLWMNPLTSTVELFRIAFFGKGTVNLAGLAYSTALTLIILMIGIVLFQRASRTFMDTV